MKGQSAPSTLIFFELSRSSLACGAACDRAISDPLICLPLQAFNALHMAKVHDPATAARQAAKCRAMVVTMRRIKVELRKVRLGAGDGNRTRVISLEG